MQKLPYNVAPTKIHNIVDLQNFFSTKILCHTAYLEDKLYNVDGIPTKQKPFI